MRRISSGGVTDSGRISYLFHIVALHRVDEELGSTPRFAIACRVHFLVSVATHMQVPLQNAEISGYLAHSVNVDHRPTADN